MKALHLLLAFVSILWTKPAPAGDAVEIAFADCPAAVQRAVQREAYLVKGVIARVERERKDHTVFYEAKISRPDGAKLTVKISAAGRVLEKKEKKGK